MEGSLFNAPKGLPFGNTTSDHNYVFGTVTDNIIVAYIVQLRTILTFCYCWRFFRDTET